MNWIMRTNQNTLKVTEERKVLLQTYVTEELAKSFQVLVKSRGGQSAREVMREAIQHHIQREAQTKPVKEMTVTELGRKVELLQELVATQETHIRLQTVLMRSICQAVGVEHIK